MSCFLVSYRPLAATAQGRLAAATHGIPPFVDGSCRREPDFESVMPSVSALCRANMFAPRLRKGDEVVYITVKSSFGESVEPLNRLVAHLRVTHVSGTHEEASEWCATQGIAIPSNCMVAGNPPKPYDQTIGKSGGIWSGYPEPTRLLWWDGEYRKRARRFGAFVHCEALYLELQSPPLIRKEHFRESFGYFPGTRTPPELPCVAVQKFLQLVLSRGA